MTYFKYDGAYHVTTGTPRDIPGIEIITEEEYLAAITALQEIANVSVEEELDNGNS